MLPEYPYALGTARSAIRELFEYGKRRAAQVGAENVFDFSLGNPSVPAPEKVNETAVELLRTGDPVALHGYTSAQGDADARRLLAEDLNARFGAAYSPDDLYLTVGAAAGHAFESLLLEKNRPVSHGAAVAHGILVALILSNMKLGLSSEEIAVYNDNILKRYFPAIRFDCNDYSRLAEIMSHDKKNLDSASFRFILLEKLGIPIYDIEISRDDFFAALDIYRDFSGI